MKRRGFQLVEVMVAVALAAGPILLAVHLVTTNVSSARFNQERATARLVLLDLVELLLGEPVETLRELAQPGTKLDELLAERISSLPDEAQTGYRDQTRDLKGKLTLQFEESLSDEAPGLARLTLVCALDTRATVRLVRLFRPEMRPRPR